MFSKNFCKILMISDLRFLDIVEVFQNNILWCVFVSLLLGFIVLFEFIIILNNRAFLLLV